LASFRESSLCPRLFSEAHPYAAAVLVDEPGVGTQKNGFVLSNGWMPAQFWKLRKADW
jgi:hypothetical protein